AGAGNGVVVRVQAARGVAHIDAVLLVVDDGAVAHGGRSGRRRRVVTDQDGTAVLAAAQRLVADVGDRQVMGIREGAVSHVDAGGDAAASRWARARDGQRAHVDAHRGAGDLYQVLSARQRGGGRLDDGRSGAGTDDVERLRDDHLLGERAGTDLH